MSANIDTRVVCISGFTQSIAEPNGIEKLWMRLRWHESPSTRVSMLEWDSDWSGFAEHCRRTANGSVADLRCVVAAYSWGVGHGFTSLAREFRRRGMRVDSAILADGVYHSWRTPWRAIVSPFWNPKIVIPDNVGEVWWLRQFLNKPQGHDLVARDPKSTTIHDPVVLDVAHAWIDDQPVFHDKVAEVVEGLSTRHLPT